MKGVWIGRPCSHISRGRLYERLNTPPLNSGESGFSTTRGSRGRRCSAPAWLPRWRHSPQAMCWWSGGWIGSGARCRTSSLGLAGGGMPVAHGGHPHDHGRGQAGVSYYGGPRGICARPDCRALAGRDAGGETAREISRPSPQADAGTGHPCRSYGAGRDGNGLRHGGALRCGSRDAAPGAQTRRGLCRPVR
jgi:hypothetical protein